MTKKFGVVWGDGLGSMIYVTSVSNLNLSCIELIGLSWVLTIILDFTPTLHKLRNASSYFK